MFLSLPTLSELSKKGQIYIRLTQTERYCFSAVVRISFERSAANNWEVLASFVDVPIISLRRTMESFDFLLLWVDTFFGLLFLITLPSRTPR